MEILTTTGSAASVAGLLVALFKFARPDAQPWLIVVVSLIVGVGASFLVALAGGDALTIQIAAQNVLTGILAAGMAAGVSRADRAADIKREAVRIGAE